MTSPSLLTSLNATPGMQSGGVAQKAKAMAAAGSSSASSTTSSNASGNSQTSLTSLGSTFLQLLTQELQNQDPTAPMDSTAMVGQMISLNQLDQLASINQLLTNQFSSSTGSGTTSGASTVTNP